MSAKGNGNNPAGLGVIPSSREQARGGFSGGVTKREYFAVRILQGLLARGGGTDLEQEAVQRADTLLRVLAGEDADG